MNILKHLLKLNLFLFVCLFLTSKCNVNLVCSWSGLPFPSLGDLLNPGIKTGKGVEKREPSYTVGGNAN